jgi:selenocysteine lyase/cysteine desulfurase
MQIITETRAWAAEMIGCEASRIAFSLNTSEGLNILAAGLDWRQGDHIVLVNQEFPANIYPFLNLRRHGVEISIVPQRNGVVSIGDIEAAMTPRTRLVAVSWVQFLSGYVIDLAEMKSLCERRGALLSVDAIQGVGAIRLDLNATPVDFLSAGAQKWQMGPQGVGIVYVSERVQNMIRQASLGWIAVKDAWDFFNYEHEPLDDARRYEGGTYNSIGITGYHGALKLFREFGHDNVDARVRANAAHTWQRAMEMGLDVITPAGAGHRAGIVTFRHDQADRLQQQLQERGMVVSARVGHIRISPHFYNTSEEIDALFDAVRELTA